MNNPKPYHLTITNNKTGEVLRDLDFGALIGAVSIDIGHAEGIAVAACNSAALIGALNAAELVVDQTYEDQPELLLLKSIMSVEVCKRIKRTTEGGENETR